VVFDLNVENDPKASVIHISGDLCIDTVETLETLVRQTLARTAVPVVLDMKNLDFIDSKGVGFLLKLKTISDGRNVVLADVNPAVHNTLMRLFVTDKFRTFKTVEDALKKL
jgi:anti-anti-sigma factor